MHIPARSVTQVAAWLLGLTCCVACAAVGSGPVPVNPEAPADESHAEGVIHAALAGAVSAATPAADEPHINEASIAAWTAGEQSAHLLARAAADVAWRQPRELDPLYARIGRDLTQGKPLIITGFYGMWFDFEDEPERNLNWGTYYGHARMLKRVHRDKHVKANYAYAKWRLVLESQSAESPLRTLVFHQGITPNRRWRAAGVEEPFDVFLVMLAYEGREEAGLALTRALRGQGAPVLELEDGTSLDLSESQTLAYFGHNFFYDYDDFAWGGLDSVLGESIEPTGVAAVGCKTGRVPGFPQLLGHNVMALLFSRSLMASEGYSTLALADGLLRQMTSRELVKHANDTYHYFHTISDPDKRVGRPFIGHDTGLFPLPRGVR